MVLVSLLSFVFTPWLQVLLLHQFDEFLTFSSAIALNEVRKYKAREKEIDEAVELETNELLENVVRLDSLVDSQICDIEKLDNIIQIYDKELRSLK